MAMPDEVLIWEGLEHDNILRLEEAYLERGHWILVTEYLSEYVDLFDYNTGANKLGTDEIKGKGNHPIVSTYRLRNYNPFFVFRSS